MPKDGLWRGANPYKNEEGLPFTLDQMDFLYSDEFDKAATFSQEAFTRGQALRGNAVAIVGDSKAAANSNGSQRRYAANYYTELLLRSDGRLRDAGKFAVAGHTIEQVRDLQLPQVLALDPRPVACIIDALTNNSANGVDLQAAWAVYEEVCDRLVASGILPIVNVLPPRSDTGQATNLDHVLFLRRLAALRGFPVLPSHDALVDVTSGGFRSGMSDDGIHPTKAGHRAIALAAIASGLLDGFPPCSIGSTKTAADQRNLIPTGFGLFQTDSNADGRANGWSAFVNGGTAVTTFSLVAPGANDGVVGNWQRAAVSAGTAQQIPLQLTIAVGDATFGAGDRIEFSGKFRSSGFDANGGSFSIELAFTAESPATVNLSVPYLLTSDVASGSFCAETVLASGITQVRPTVSITPSATGPVQLDVAELTVRNLSRIGIA